LIIERRLEQAHLRLEEIALSLRDQKRRRESHFETALLRAEALLASVAPASPRDAFGAAANLPRGLANGFGA